MEQFQSWTKNMENIVGKGSKRRPRLVSLAEEDLRWKLFLGKISEKYFNKLLKDIRNESAKNRRIIGHH